MINEKEYLNMVQAVSDEYGLTIESYYQNFHSFKTTEETEEVFRMIYDKDNKVVGISFHIEAIPSDAIQILDFIKNLTSKKDSVKLLACFFIDNLGATYTGLEAKVAAEQDREDKFIKEFSKLTKDEIEELSFKIEEKDENITWH